jgi:putative endonuclease
MYYVYVLQSKKDKSLYIGFTKDLKKRFAEHNKGLCKSTDNNRPLHLAFYEAYSSESNARKREKRLKQFKNAYKELVKRIGDCLEK